MTALQGLWGLWTESLSPLPNHERIERITMDPVTAAQECADAGTIDLDSQAGATIFEYSRRYPTLPGWAVVAKILSVEVSWQRDESVKQRATLLAVRAANRDEYGHIHDMEIERILST